MKIALRREWQKTMLFGKSIAIDEEGLKTVASASSKTSARSIAESEFVAKLKAGDAEAFDALVNRYSGDVYALLYRLTDNAEEAGDLTQETFLKALKAVGKFRGDSELKTWLIRIAINESRNRFRWWKRRRREMTISLDDHVGNSEAAVHESLAGNSEDPEGEALRREREKLLLEALRSLPDVYRESVILFEIEGYSYEQICRLLDINLGTVKSRIARGREELRKRLKGF